MNKLKYILFISVLISLLACNNKKELAKNTKSNQETSEIQFKETFHQANSEKMIGHDDKALELFNKCIVLNPKSAASYFALSNIYLKQNNKQKALEYGHKAYGLNNQNKWYVVNLADIYFTEGNYHQSANFYQILIENYNEKNIEYKYKYAESLIYSNQALKAIKVLDEIEKETGKSPEMSLTKHDLYNSIGKNQEANQEISDLLIEFPDNEEIRTTILNYYLQTNQTEKAKQMAQDILKINPLNGNANIGLADIEIRQNNINQSFDYLDKGFASNDVSLDKKLQLLNGLTSYAFDTSNPDSKIINKRLKSLYEKMYVSENENPEFLSLYGAYLDVNNEKLKAREMFLKSLSLNINNYKAWSALLNIDYNTELYDSLYFDGQKAIEVFPTQPMIYLLTGIGAYEIGKYKQAEELLYLGSDLVIKDLELKAEFKYHLGKNYWKQNQKDKAKSYFQQALKIYPENPKIYNGYALLLLESGDLNEAENQIIKALLKDSKNPEFLNTYGLILMAQKQYIEAVKKFETAIIYDYDNPKLIENYGDALYLSGQKEKAIKMWIKSKELGNINDILERKIANKTYYEN
jgi:tetratricopeptide (TPR) repeat protein